MTKSLVAAALGLATPLCVCTLALAQTPIAYRVICQPHGASLREELPDRKGHFLVTASATCRVEGGPMDGATQSSSSVSSVDGDESTALISHATNRKAGSWSVSVVDAGKSNVQRGADGKVTGSIGSGTGHFLVAVGDAAPLAGRKYTYSFKTVAGQMQYVIDVKVE